MTGAPRIGRDVGAAEAYSRLGRALTLRGHRHRYLRTAAAVATGVLVLPNPSLAADLPLKAPALRAVYDWTGLYIGAHTGFTRGTSSATLTDPTVATDKNVFTGATGGVQAGYNWRLNSGLLLGVEGDISFPNYLPSNHVVSSATTAPSSAEERRDYVATLRARLGYSTGAWLFYATGGAAFAGERFLSTPTGGNEDKVLNTRFGWVAGAGVEYAFAPHWSARLEYLYSKFENANVTFPTGAQYSSSMDFQSLRIGLNRKIDWPGVPSYDPKSSLANTESDRWEIHGQGTYLPQGYPPSLPATAARTPCRLRRRPRRPGATACF